MEYFWNYSILLYQKSFQYFILKSESKYSLSYVWVISAFFLSILFGGYLLDNMVKVQPVNKINSINDIADNKKRIIAIQNNALVKYANRGETELAQKLSALLATDLDYYYSNLGDISESLKQGSHVMLNQRLVLIFNALRMSELETNIKDQEQFIDSLHISKEDGGLEPYFIFINVESNRKISPLVNKM